MGRKKAAHPVTETARITDLKPHARNYREHPDDQLAHIVASIEQHGFYRNVVVARDGTILAGHGVVRAAEKMGRDEVPVVRLDLDPLEPRALKVLAGDNEIANLAEVDDRSLTELLKEINNTDVSGLLGTGFDEQILANLVMVTRPESEIADLGEAAEWLGMPEHDPGGPVWKIMVSFKSEAERGEFAEKLGLKFAKKRRTIWSSWWPPRDRADSKSVLIEG